MRMKVLTAGLLGALVLIVWTFVINGVFRFQATIDMKQLAAEREVYGVLCKHVVSPGRYCVNPQPTADGQFPAGQPVFSILYSGMGHETAGSAMLVGLVVFLLAPLIAAWLLSHASQRVLSSFPRKLRFFVAIGLLLAIFTDVPNWGIGGYPAKDALWLGLNHIGMWTLVGLVVAWRITPKPATP